MADGIKKSRFVIERLEDRIAPSAMSCACGSHKSSKKSKKCKSSKKSHKSSKKCKSSKKSHKSKKCR